MPPGVVGALNTVLDGVPLLIPQTGELVQPHENFRFAATGNAIADDDQAAIYRGTQRMNPALLYRFLKSKVGYLEEIKEVAALHRNAPNLDLGVVKALVKLAQDVRHAHIKGEMAAVLSTRTLVMTVKLLDIRSSLVVKNPMEQVKFALHLSFLDAINPSEATAIVKILEKIGIVLEGAKEKTTAKPSRPAPPAKPGVPSPARQGFASMMFAFNPNRQGSGSAAFYGACIDPDRRNGKTFNGGIAPASVRWSKAKADAESRIAVNDKVMSRGYALIVPEFEVPAGIKVSDLVDSMANLVRDVFEKKAGSVRADGMAMAIPTEARPHLVYWARHQCSVDLLW